MILDSISGISVLSNNTIYGIYEQWPKNRRIPKMPPLYPQGHQKNKINSLSQGFVKLGLKLTVFFYPPIFKGPIPANKKRQGCTILPFKIPIYFLTSLSSAD